MNRKSEVSLKWNHRITYHVIIIYYRSVTLHFWRRGRAKSEEAGKTESNRKRLEEEDAYE